MPPAPLRMIMDWAGLAAFGADKRCPRSGHYPHVHDVLDRLSSTRATFRGASSPKIVAYSVRSSITPRFNG